MDLHARGRGARRLPGWVLVFGIGISPAGAVARAGDCPEAEAILRAGLDATWNRSSGPSTPGSVEGIPESPDLPAGDSRSIPGGLEDWVAGRRLEQAGRLEEAFRRFLRVLGQPVEDDARLRAGGILLRLGDLAGARALLSGISPASRGWGEARLLLARALVKEGRPEGAAVLLRDLARGDLPVAWRARAVRMLAEVRADQGRREEALALVRRAWIEMPGGEAERELRQALATLGAPPGPLDRVLRDWMEGSPSRIRELAREARRRFQALAALDPAWPMLVQGQAARQGPAGPDRALEWFSRADREARDSRVRALARQAAGDLLVSLGRDREAMDRYASVPEADPGGGLEGSAWYSLARCAFRVGDHARGQEALDRLESLGPFSVTASQVEWERVRGLLVQGRPTEALDRIERAVRRRSPGDGLAGGDLERWIYYRGVARLAVQDRVGGLEDLDRVAANAPHTWYGILARDRLAAEGIPGPPRRPRRTTCRESVAPLWWMAAGEEKEAVEELEARLAAGVIDPAVRGPLVRMLTSSSSPRTRARARRILGNTLPVPGDLYPMPFSREVEAAASESGLPRALLWAVARVESGFRPGARSPRGARGLMQLLAPVARRVAGMGLGEPALARKWTTPGPNLRLGAAYLAALARHFRGHLPLALAAYHAGPGAARRFLVRLGHLPTDLFVDSLPYPDTIRYIQSVLALDGGYRQQTGEEAWEAAPWAPPPPDPGPFRWSPGDGIPPGASRPEGPAPVPRPSSRWTPTGHPGAPRSGPADPRTGG